MAGGPPRSAGRGKGADPAKRRTGPAPPGTALGPGRSGLPFRYRTGPGFAEGSVPGPLAASGLPFHVRAGLQGGLPVLLDDRRRIQRLRGPSGQSRRDPDRRVARAARQAAGVPAAHGWTFPWASSEGGAFNYDFNVSISEEQQRDGSAEYNYQRRGHAMTQVELPPVVGQFAAMCGTDAPTYVRDRPGLSAFVLRDGEVYHTYSTYARGLDGLWGAYQWLDRAPLGRNESGGVWWRRHDEYGG